MSLEPLDLDKFSRVGLALYILKQVVPEIKDYFEAFPRRLALAEAWLKVVCELEASYCKNVELDSEKWSAEDLDKAVAVLIKFASDVLKSKYD